MYLGIDPGASGAIAFHSGTALHHIIDMPCTPKRSGKGHEVNPQLLALALRDLDITHAYVEQVGAMPGQGVTSMFTFGRSFGVIEGVLAALSIPVTYVRPNTWKKFHSLTGKDKDAARTLILSKYPERTEDFQRKKDIGRADALLILEYGLSLR